MKTLFASCACLLVAGIGVWAITLASAALGAWTAAAVLLWIVLLSKLLAVALALGRSRSG